MRSDNKSQFHFITTDVADNNYGQRKVARFFANGTVETTIIPGVERYYHHVATDFETETCCEKIQDRHNYTSRGFGSTQLRYVRRVRCGPGISEDLIACFEA